MTRTPLVCDHILFVIRMTDRRHTRRVLPSFHNALSSNLVNNNATTEAIDCFAS
jgi:hypothetical protein